MIQPHGVPPSVALIGTAGYATVYVDWLVGAHRNGLVKIVAATVLPSELDTPAARELATTEAIFYENYQDMFAADNEAIDLCFIPTGIQWHARMAIAALEAGCNVLVEKPLAGSVADVDSVREAEKRCGRWVAVGFQDMYTSEIATLKKQLTEGSIGKVQSVSMIGAWPRPEAYYRRNHWAGKLETDGMAVYDSPLNNAFAHFVNLSLFLASDIPQESVEAKVDKAELYHAHDIESFDTAVVQATASNGVKLWFGVTHSTTETREPRIRVVGENGTVEWAHESECEIRIEGSPCETIQVPRYAETRQEMFLRVINRLSEPTLPICDTSIGRCHTAFIADVHKSAEIQPVQASIVEPTLLGENGTTVPAIRDIVARLEQAFEQSGDLGDLTEQPTTA